MRYNIKMVTFKGVKYIFWNPHLIVKAAKTSFHMLSLKSNTGVTLWDYAALFGISVLANVAAVVLIVWFLFSVTSARIMVFFSPSVLPNTVSITTTENTAESISANKPDKRTIEQQHKLSVPQTLFPVYCAFTRFTWKLSQLNKPKLSFKTRGLHLLIIHSWRQIC